MESGCDFCCGVCGEKFVTARKLGHHHKKEHLVVKKKIPEDNFLETIFETPEAEDMFKPFDDFLNTLGPDDWKEIDVKNVVQPQVTESEMMPEQQQPEVLNSVPVVDGRIVEPALTLKFKLCQFCISRLCYLYLPDGTVFYNVYLCPQCIKKNQ